MGQAKPGFDPEKFKATARSQWNASGAGYSAWGAIMLAVMQPAVTRCWTWRAFVRVATSWSWPPAAESLRFNWQSALAPGAGCSRRTWHRTFWPAPRRRRMPQASIKSNSGKWMASAWTCRAGAFDAAISSLGLMHFPNPGKSVEAQSRALKPGGKVAAVVISTPERSPYFSIPARVIRETAQLPPPQPGRPGPFALGAPGVVDALFAEAGLRDVSAESIPGRVELTSVAEHVQFL